MQVGFIRKWYLISIRISTRLPCLILRNRQIDENTFGSAGCRTVHGAVGGSEDLRIHKVFLQSSIPDRVPIQWD